jgi:Beta-lactamase
VNFLDGIVPLQLDREDIAGATVAVVKDEKPLFTKGYSYADVKNKKPVTAETLMPSMSGRAIDTRFGGNFRRRCLQWRVSVCSGWFLQGICYLSTRIINSCCANLILSVSIHISLAVRSYIVCKCCPPYILTIHTSLSNPVLCHAFKKVLRYLRP